MRAAMMALRGGEMGEAVKGSWVFRRPKTWFGGRRFPQLATFGLTLERRVRNKWGGCLLSTNQRRGTRQFSSQLRPKLSTPSNWQQCGISNNDSAQLVLCRQSMQSWPKETS